MIDVVAAVIIENDTVLLASRPADKPPAGWEFPGGKIEAGETPFAAVIRELQEELALDIEPLAELCTLSQEHLRLRFILARRHPDSLPTARENQQFKWQPLSPAPPEGLLKNDLIFWKFLCQNKINYS